MFSKKYLMSALFQGAASNRTMLTSSAQRVFHTLRMTAQPRPAFMIHSQRNFAVVGDELSGAS